jgi:hypothetical protein
MYGIQVQVNTQNNKKYRIQTIQRRQRYSQY